MKERKQSKINVTNVGLRPEVSAKLEITIAKMKLRDVTLTITKQHAVNEAVLLWIKNPVYRRETK